MLTLAAAAVAPPVAPPKPSAVLAASAVAVDGGSGRVLWARDPDTPRYPASTTKIMTTLLLLERTKPTDVIVAPKGVDKIEEASMHLKPGERLTAKNLAYAMMLRSANDGCVAAAVHLSGSVPAFAREMNERAREIGLTHTFFRNPNGLPDPGHRISALDLALIGREAMRRPDFREIARTPKYRIARSVNTKDTWMVSKNKWLRKDPSADGIKTGYTRAAGATYVGSASRKGFRVITALLKTPNWQADHKALLDFAFREYRKSVEFAPGATVEDVAPVPGGPTVAAVTKEGYYVLERIGEPLPVGVFEPRADLVLPVAAGAEIGEIVYTFPDGTSQREPVLAGADVAAPVAAGTVGGGTGGLWIGGGLFAGAYLFGRRRTGRRERRAWSG